MTYLLLVAPQKDLFNHYKLLSVPSHVYDLSLHYLVSHETSTQVGNSQTEIQ